jgi:hypothetical protein
MPRRRSRLPICFAMLALAGLVAAAPAAAQSGKCKAPSKSRVAAQSTASIVYTRPSTVTQFSTVYGCLYSSGKLHKLPQSGSERLYGYTLAGRYLAFASNDDEPAAVTSSASIYLVDLSTGKTVFADDAYPVEIDVTEEFSYSIDAIALRSTGALAWLTDASINRQQNLVGRRSGTKATVLDRGTDVRLGSLALSSKGTLYWTRGSAVKTATLG